MLKKNMFDATIYLSWPTARYKNKSIKSEFVGAIVGAEHQPIKQVTDLIY